MSRSKAIAVLFYLGAVLIGAVGGVALDRSVVRDWLDKSSRDPSTQRQTFATKLGLTKVQELSADSIFGAARRADSVLMAPALAQMMPLRPVRDSIMKAARDRFRAQLNADQQRTYDQMRAGRARPNDGRR